MNNKGQSIVQILILVIGILAFSYAIGSSINTVSAQASGGDCSVIGQKTCSLEGGALLSGYYGNI